jgi:hypothetical protein
MVPLRERQTSPLEWRIACSFAGTVFYNRASRHWRQVLWIWHLIERGWQFGEEACDREKESKARQEDHGTKARPEEGRGPKDR